MSFAPYETLADRLRFEELLVRLSSTFVHLPSHKVETAFETALRQLGQFLGLDRVTLYRLSRDAEEFVVAYSWSGPGVGPVPRVSVSREFPWITAQILCDRPVGFSRPQELPLEAGCDAEAFRRRGVLSNLAIPMMAAGRILGSLAFVTLTGERSWPDELVQRLRLVGEVFANALAQKEAEDTVRESESRFRIVADSAPVLIWMSGEDALCTFFNKPWLDFTGRTAEQEMGDGWTKGIHPDDLPECLEAYRESFEARRPFVLQYRLRRHDGEYRWISDNGVPRYDAEGHFAGYIGSCLDITDRMRAEERFRQVFEAAPNAMVMVSEDGRIVLINAQGEKVFGYGRAELVGLPIETLIPERFQPEHPMHRKHFVGNPQTRTIGAGRELFGRRKDGSEVPIEIGLNPIRTTEGLFVVASVIDITERRKAEAETRELRQELAHIARVATMGELTAAIVHELGQPLSAILSNAQAGLRGLASGKTDVNDVRDILEDIVADDQRAAQVMQHLRSLFQRGHVERRPLRLNQVINDVVRVVVRDAELRRMAIVTDLASELPLVSGDRIQLQQVLLNLVVNAFDAMAEVTDWPRKVILRTRALDGNRVQVDVADTGPGIAAEKLGSIFKPFVTSKAGGMGMGLSVSRSIVTDHEGRLWVENRPEGGATFHIVLPTITDAEPE
jgi:PAS domain S-box-containing protein